MLVDLLQTTTRDGVRLDAAFQPAPSPGSGPLDAVLCVHGTGSNFYGSTLFDVLAARCLSLGIGVLRVNTRGHDLMSTATTQRGGRRLGAAYETFDDCRHDVAAWGGWLKQNVGPRVGLVGHSAGAVKCLYAQALEPELAAAAVVAVSPPRLSHSWFLASEKGREFRDQFEQARELVRLGEPGHLLDVTLPMPFVVTAAGYVEKYGPDERYNYLTFLGRVHCPVLVTLGEIEVANNVAFRGSPEAIAQAAPHVAVEVLGGADHFYTGVREPLVAVVERWLRALPRPLPPGGAA